MIKPRYVAHLAGAMGAYAVVGGLLTLGGWFGNIPRLTDWPNSGISMMPNAAVCAMCAGMALLLLVFERQRAVAVLGLLVGLIGAATQFEYLSGVDLGIDGLLISREWGQRGTVVPGRMGPPGSTSWTIIGLSLMLSTGSLKMRRSAIAGGMLAIGIAMLSLVGHLFGADPLFTIPHLTTIAVQTSSIIFLIGAGIVVASPDLQPMKTLLSDGAAGILARRALPFIVLLPMVVGWLRLRGEQAELFDTAFGTALRTLVEVALLTSLLWWAVAMVRAHEEALRRSAAELQRQSRQLATFLETAAIGLHRVGPDGIILWANEAELKTLGYAPEEYIGHHIAKFHVDQTVIDDILARLHAGQNLLEIEARMRCKDGSIKEVLIDSSVLREDGRFLHSQCFTRDITDRNRAEKALRESEERYRSLVSVITDVPWTMDANGAFIRTQPAWEAYTGSTWEEYQGFGWMNSLHPDDRDGIKESWQRARTSCSVHETHGRLWHAASRQWRHYVGRAIPLLDAEGSIREWVGACTDIEDQTRVSDEIQTLLESERAARSEAEHAGRMKDEFLATLSHELRTPLNAILGYATLLRMAKMDETQTQEAAETIERNSRIQAQLIEDLLDMNRIISGKIRLDVQRLDVPALVQAAISTVRPSAEAKGVRIETVLDPLAGPVRGDPGRMQQIVWNLLSNAVKFTARDGKVQVVLERVNSHIEIIVADTGVGISADFLPHVFDRFRQADGSTTRRYGGLGLGLAIVKQLVELHGGSIRAQSPGEGQGASFIVSIPIMALLETPEADETQHPRTSQVYSQFEGCEVDLSGVRVLVVDDEPDSTRLVKRVLEECKAEVSEAASAQQAIALLSEAQYNVLVSDIGMPGEDGYQLIRRVRALGNENKSIPALALTAFARSEDRRRAAMAGFQTHLSKPVDAPELLATVANLARRTGYDSVIEKQCDGTQ